MALASIALEYFTAIQSPELTNLSPPREPWEEFMDRMPPSKRVGVQDVYDRWEVRQFRCVNRDCPASKGEALPKPGKCESCGRKLGDGGPLGVGEKRAYLGWLTGLMEAAEGQFFWGTIAQHPDALMFMGLVPVVRELLLEVAKLRAEVARLVAELNPYKAADIGKPPTAESAQ